MPNNIPSRRAATSTSLTGVLDVATRKSAEALDVMLPVKVMSYDRATNRAVVEHQIQQVTTDGTAIDRGIIASVPALILGDTKYFISFEIPTGTLGWIKAADRDITNFLAMYEKSTPSDNRIHDFNSGLFIPDRMHDYTIASDDSFVIQNQDGSRKVSMSDSETVLKSGDGEIIINNIGITFKIGSKTILTMDSGGISCGVPLTDSNSVVLDNHVHIGHGSGNETGRPLNETL